MSDVDRLQKIKDQNKERAKRYYEANKATIAERRKVKKSNVKLPPVTHEPVSLQKAVEGIQQKVESPNSQRIYINTLRTFMETIAKCTDLFDCLSDSQRVIDIIDSAKPKNSEQVYSINSRKTIYQTILKLITILDLTIPQTAVDAYKEKFEELKLESLDQTKERVASDDKKVMTFEKYLPMVREKFGEGSKEYLIALLYQLYGFRDDLQLKIVSKKPDSQEENYIVIPRLNIGKHYIILNHFKTAKRNGQQIVDIPMSLAKVIRAYAKSHGLGEGSYLFGNERLSGFIKKFNEKLGLPITINTYRQMRVSSVLSSDVKPTAKERVKLAKEMNHTPMTSERYARKIKMEREEKIT